MKIKQDKNLHFKRVDVQVSLLTALITIVSCTSIYLYFYNITYHDMLISLRERVFSIYNYLESEMDKTTFIDINVAEDMNKESYINTKELFRKIKESSGVQYLYTAKSNDNNELIYVIDGLPAAAEDFRKPGDIIEEETTIELKRALLGEEVLPKDIKQTPWGEIFVTYLPIHNDKNDVVGVIGIEFFAEHQYKTYRQLRIMTPFIIAFACILSSVFAVYYFRRISNPQYKDLANTDYLTGLKNRNSFELDTQNMCALQNMDKTGLIVADLNGLKNVNDKFGHKVGDEYIKRFAEILNSVKRGNEVIYRVGGDEFVVLMPKATEKELDHYIHSVQDAFTNTKFEVEFDASCSIGKAICKGNSFEDMEEAYKNADELMYQNKSKYYATKNHS